MQNNDSRYNTFASNQHAMFSMDRQDLNSPDIVVKLQQFYWQAKHKYLAKVQRSEDSCIVLGDSELDAKLEILNSIESTTEQVTRILDLYQDCLFKLASEQNSLATMLKECSKVDRSMAGNAMSVVAKTMNEASHQQIQLYMPLLRLHQEMETFYSRACEDSSSSVGAMEQKRSKYRASLLWMKDVSESFTDPDTFRQLNKLKKVQAQVKKNKEAFDENKSDIVQKIDLLMASRCNLINNSLGAYQASLEQILEKNAENFKQAITSIKEQDFHEYEFKTLKQLNPLPVSRGASLEDLSNTKADSQVQPLLPKPELPLLQLDEAFEAISLSTSQEPENNRNSHTDVVTGNLLGDFDA